MRFPKLTDLDADQKAIYNGAPPMESILVIGPPGTGKTVMAFHRAAFLQALAKKKEDKALEPRVIMFSKVLSAYTGSRAGVATGVGSSTMHSWVHGWWRKFAKSSPPTLPSDTWSHDWQEIIKVSIAAASQAEDKTHWGHLIVDEGQDFPQAMYASLGMLASLSKARKSSPPAITVFADENQRLNSSNSTISEIYDALALPVDRIYVLRKNYRNSRQIALFARHYYVGLSSGQPDVPNRIGPSKPKVVIASGIETVRHRIAAYSRNHPGSDIGVLCAYDGSRKQIFNSLSSRLSTTCVRVQTYSSKNQDHPASELQFDSGGSVTVICFQSAKGLEFDAVFVIDPFVESGGASAEHSKMQLYVMASRARDYLELLVMNKPHDLSARLPPGDFYDEIEE